LKRINFSGRKVKPEKQRSFRKVTERKSMKIIIFKNRRPL
jgi:hypothetical protein